MFSIFYPVKEHKKLGLPNNIRIASKIKGCHDLVKLHCNTHNSNIEVPYSYIKSRKFYCDQCAKEHKYSKKSVTNFVMNKLKIKYPDFIWEVVNGNSKLIKFTCHKGIKHTANPYNLLNQQFPCRQCANFEINNNKMLDFNTYEKIVKEKNGKLVEVLKENYKGTGNDIEFICKNCKCKRKTRAGALMIPRKYGCLNCKASFAVRLSNKVKFNWNNKKLFMLGSKAEFTALLYLKLEGYKYNEIVGQSEKIMPLISYNHKKQNRLYTPDFYIPHQNLIIEVKGKGISRRRNEFYVMKSKRLACIEQGYKFRLIIIDKYCMLENPIDWHLLNLTDFKKQNNLKAVVK